MSFYYYSHSILGLYVLTTRIQILYVYPNSVHIGSQEAIPNVLSRLHTTNKYPQRDCCSWYNWDIIIPTDGKVWPSPTKRNMASSGPSSTFLRIMFMNWPTVKSVGTRYLLFFSLGICTLLRSTITGTLSGYFFLKDCDFERRFIQSVSDLNFLMYSILLCTNIIWLDPCIRTRMFERSVEEKLSPSTCHLRSYQKFAFLYRCDQSSRELCVHYNGD